VKLVSNKHLSSISYMKCRYVGSKYMHFMTANTMQLMSARQITNHDCHVILDPNICYIQDHCTGHLVGTGPCLHDS
jgi:hypothetical protein